MDSSVLWKGMTVLVGEVLVFAFDGSFPSKYRPLLCSCCRPLLLLYIMS